MGLLLVLLVQWCKGKLQNSAALRENKSGFGSCGLEAGPKRSQRQIAKELSASVGGVNYALQALVKQRSIHAGNFERSDIERARLYLLKPQGAARKIPLATAFLSGKVEGMRC